MPRIRLDSIPQLPIRTPHLGPDVGVKVRTGRFDRDGVDAGLVCDGCCGKLDFEAFGKHSQRVPGPDDCTVVGACCKYSSMRGIGAVGRVAMRTTIGVERPAGSMRRMELARASSVRRCWEMQAKLEEWTRSGSNRRRKPERYSQSYQRE